MYLGIETVSCPLLQRKAKMHMYMGELGTKYQVIMTCTRGGGTSF